MDKEKELEEYIKTMRSIGHPDGKIISELKRVGWEDNQITEGLNKLEDTQEKTQQETPKEQAPKPSEEKAAETQHPIPSHHKKEESEDLPEEAQKEEKPGELQEKDLGGNKLYDQDKEETKEPAKKEAETQDIKTGQEDPEELLKNVQNFEELYDALDKIGTIEGSSQVQPYTPEYNKQLIEHIRDGQGDANEVTATYGLRSIVKKFLWRERVNNAQNFKELYDVLDEISDDGKKFIGLGRGAEGKSYAPHYNKDAIEKLRKGQGSLSDIMPIDLREKVKELIKTEQRSTPKGVDPGVKQAHATQEVQEASLDKMTRVFVESLAEKGEIEAKEVPNITEKVIKTIKTDTQ